MMNFADMPVFNREIETAPRERIEEIQLEKLKAQVAWTYERVSWYRAELDKRGVTPADIKSLSDVRLLPFTDKAVLRETFPYGLFAVPLDEVIELRRRAPRENPSS